MAPGRWLLMLSWAGCSLIAGEGPAQSEALAVLSAILQLSALHDLDMTSHCDFFTHKSISIFSNEVGSLSQFSLKLHHASIILSLGVRGWGGGTSNSFRLTPKHSLPCFLCGNAIMGAFCTEKHLLKFLSDVKPSVRLFTHTLC